MVSCGFFGVLYLQNCDFFDHLAAGETSSAVLILGRLARARVKRSALKRTIRCGSAMLKGRPQLLIPRNVDGEPQNVVGSHLWIVPFATPLPDVTVLRIAGR